MMLSEQWKRMVGLKSMNDRRGFLKQLAGVTKGALALSVLPGLSAVDSLIGSKAIWTPDIRKPVVLETDAIQVLVRHWGSDVDILNFAMSTRGGFAWVTPPGNGIVSKNGELVSICLSTDVISLKGRFGQVMDSSGRLTLPERMKV